MLTNEQKALRQIISYMNQNKAEQLSFYFQLIDPQSFLDKQHKKSFKP